MLSQYRGAVYSTRLLCAGSWILSGFLAAHAASRISRHLRNCLAAKPSGSPPSTPGSPAAPRLTRHPTSSDTTACRSTHSRSSLTRFHTVARASCSAFSQTPIAASFPQYPTSTATLALRSRRDDPCIPNTTHFPPRADNAEIACG